MNTPNGGKRKLQSSIATWCTHKRKAPENVELEIAGAVTGAGCDELTILPSAASASTSATTGGSSTSAQSAHCVKTPSRSSMNSMSPSTVQPVIHDIGLYMPGGDLHHALTDDIRYKMLTERWLPPPRFDMPYTVRRVRGSEERRYLRRDHLERCPYLGFSPSRQGVYCVPCAMFGPACITAGRSNQALGRLVTEPLTRFDKLFGKDGYLTTHETLDYHKTALIRSEEFRLRMATGGRTVAEDVDRASSEQAAENRRRLAPIVNTILFCGRQNIALRGHRDDGSLLQDDGGQDETSIVRNEGNFRALLKFRIDAGDNALKEHLESAASSATYISKTTQNELIKAAGTVIKSKIVRRVAAAKFFTILADETTDASRSEIMSLCVRYVTDTCVIREDFMDFVEVMDVTGAGLAKTIIDYLRQNNVNADYLVGQGYDGASAMSGRYRGVQACIQRQYNTAVYVHCASHCLNLTLSRSCELKAIRNAEGVMQQTANFINASAKRVAIMENCLAESAAATDTGRRRVRRLCATRWVERHDAVISFIQLYPAIQDCLTKCSALDSTTATTARMLLLALAQPEFIVATCVLSSVLSVTHGLSVHLQTVEIDLLQALSHVADVVAVLESRRQSAEDSFSTIWKQAGELADVSETELKCPRTAARQTNRSNVSADSPEEYFRRTIYIPFVDHVISDLHDRFDDHKRGIFCLSAIVPERVSSYNFSDIMPAITMYSSFIGTSDSLSAEFELWQQKWATASDPPKTAIDALASCNATLFPNIAILLQILATLPVTTSTAEHTFSTLKLVKSYLRSTMSEDRLTSLAHIYIHGQDVDVDEVIDSFAATGRHKLNFLK